MHRSTELAATCFGRSAADAWCNRARGRRRGQRGRTASDRRGVSLRWRRRPLKAPGPLPVFRPGPRRQACSPSRQGIEHNVRTGGQEGLDYSRAASAVGNIAGCFSRNSSAIYERHPRRKSNSGSSVCRRDCCSVARPNDSSFKFETFIIRLSRFSRSARASVPR